MTSDEPSRHWQDQQHQQILQHDITAFAELCERALPHLVTFLRQRFPQSDSHLHEISAIDCLLNYQMRPGQYHPDQLSLFAYLRMAARGDLLNLIEKNKREAQRLVDIDDPTIQSQISAQDAPNNKPAMQDWLAERTSMPAAEIREAFYAELDDTDRQVLQLMLAGVRETAVYADVMEITHLDIAEQKREVKRAKDRLSKRAWRFGKRIARYN